MRAKPNGVRAEPSWTDESNPASPISTSEIVIDVSGLSNRFGAQIVHENLGLQIRRGEVLAIIGGSGSGKSLLLRSMIGLHKPGGGQVKVMGVDMVVANAAEQAKVARHWGVMFQDGALFSTLTVLENIQLPMLEHQPLPVELMRAIAQLKIALVGLNPDAANKLPSQLSGGMRKRVGVARALALDPAILFLDEPSSGLDPIGAAELDSLLVTLCRSLGLTVIMITHDLDSIFTCCDRVAVLADKRVIAIDTPARIAEHPHPWIRACFGGPRGRNAGSAVAKSPVIESARPAHNPIADIEIADKQVAEKHVVQLNPLINNLSKEQ